MAPFAVRMAVLCQALAALAAAEKPRDGPTYEQWKGNRSAEASQAAADVAREKKMAAVNKVTDLLKTLQAKVLVDGEKEAAAYNKFSCFCKDTSKEKTEEIEKGTDEQASLSSTIEGLSTKRNSLDTSIAALQKDIEGAQKEMKAATEARALEHKEYSKNEADLSGALSALEGAIETVKASKAPLSLAQLQAVSKTAREASLLAGALGLGGAKAKRPAGFLQQAPDVPMEDYKFHSDDIIKTLEKLLRDFRAEKNDVDAAEVKAVAQHESFMQERSDFVKQRNVELAEAQKAKEVTAEEIARHSSELSTVSAELLDDKQYLSELSTMCANKAKTWDQRSKVRQDELFALEAAIAVVGNYVRTRTSAATIRFAQQGVSLRLAEAVAEDPQSMEAVEAEAEAADAGAAPVLLQGSREIRHATRNRQPGADGAQLVAEMLRSRGLELKSPLLSSLATRISEDPFAKVKQLIQELIERLLQEAGNQANQKGWCNKSIADAKQKRQYAAAAVEHLNGEMAELEAERDTLNEELKVLGSQIQDLKDSVAKANQMRAEEKATNTATVIEAKAGRLATEQAMQILYRFYRTADNNATVALSLSQGPFEDAPDAAFKNGEAYHGAQGEAGGIMGMLEVIKSDFQRTVQETEQAELEAYQEHLEFTTESGKSLATKTVAEKEKTKYKDAAEDKLSIADEDLDSQTTILQTSIRELMELKPVCIDTGMSYAERVARREDEISALNKALCILGAYEKYGPDGTGDC
eukprot:CAMPEP_0168379670 /NCGR_PEP_ID=MMETSP0228-20121227/11965_1 /TAXON_ID=133427 /ORGANISM="Protoceratium reticulatum, Strain CCCM 535 (=CCMP 1889)" /LENGTH=753 /DNA_ID=CAMNT_0008392713 /DNA_START=56 /DNA_END=2317 /DNA_ORIENTATION=-